MPFENVFVLCTGRCGSVTFARACSHLKNWSSGHETRAHMMLETRLDYPGSHIEVDNRLSWLLGRLDARYGGSPLYVHLHRDPSATARSFAKRLSAGIMNAYAVGMIMQPPSNPAPYPPLAYAVDMVETMTQNIRLFLKDKPNVLDFPLEQAAATWPSFWEAVDGKGDFAASLAEWNIRHNASNAG